MREDYDLARAIILKSLKSGKLLTEFKLWDTLDYDDRMKALRDMTCIRCGKVSKLTGTYQHIFGTDPCCKSCDNYTTLNFPLVYKEANI